MKDCIIIGAGPAGIGAALELKKVDIDFLFIDKVDIGGKVNIAPSITNYPGHTHIQGPDLVTEYKNKLIKEDIPFIKDEIISVKKVNNYFEVSGKETVYKAKSVIITTGSSARKLVDGFNNFINYFVVGTQPDKNKHVAIFGGGNAALKEAIYLADKMGQVYLIHRRNEFRGMKTLVEELQSRSNVKILTPYIWLSMGMNPPEINSYSKEIKELKHIELYNTETAETLTIEVDEIYSSIGQVPNTDFVKDLNILNDSKEIIYDRKDNSTAIEGLFAAGDVTATPVKQIYASEFSGKKAAQSVIKYLEESI